MYEKDLSPITAKEYTLKNWNKYGFTKIKSQDEFLGLLNMLQAWDLTLEDMHNCVQNGDNTFHQIWNYGGWETLDDLYEAMQGYVRFYTDEEFIDYILEQIENLKYDGYDDPVSEIKEWTYGKNFWYVDHPTDTMIRKTEDGYVFHCTY